jgi:hypothetical protein
MSEKTKYIGVLKKDFNALKTVPKEYLADKDIVRAAFDRQWYEFIEFYNGYPDIFLGLKSFELVDATLRYNKDFVKELIPLCSGYLFSYLPKALREDKDLFLFALSHIGSDYVISNLLDHCQEDGEDWDENEILNLEFNLRCEIERKCISEKAGKNLLKDKEVVCELLEKEPDAFCFVDNLLYDVREIALKAVSKGGYNYSHLSEKLKHDQEIIETALQGEGLLEGQSVEELYRNLKYYVIKYIPESIQNNISFWIEIITDTQKRFIYPELFFQFISDGLKEDKNLILELVRIRPSIQKYIGESLRNDPDVLALKK